MKEMCTWALGLSADLSVMTPGTPTTGWWSAESWAITALSRSRVLHRRLGLMCVVKVTKESAYGTVSSNFAADNVGCVGSEEHLANCSYSSQDDCGGSEGAGVVCDTRTSQEIQEEQEIVRTCFEEDVSYHYGEYLDFDVVDSSLECQKHCINHRDCNYFTFYAANHKCYRKVGSDKRTVSGAVSGPRNCSNPNPSLDPAPTSTTESQAQREIRLEGGRFAHEGNIMVNGRPVCDDGFTLVNAHVVCRELGYRRAVSFTTESRYGRTSPYFAMDDVRCDGTEARLLNCRHSKVNCI